MWRPSSLQQNRFRVAAPRNDTLEPKTKLRVINDHGGDDVEVGWVSQSRSHDLEHFPPFGFQLYVLNSAGATATNPSFPASLMQWIEQVGGIVNPDMRCHFSIYRGHFDNILQCMAHQRREVQYRNRNGIWPRLVSAWTTDNERGYRGFILVIDRDDWTATGLTFVDFDRLPYDREDVYYLMNHLPDGDEFVARARKHRDVTSYGQLLLDYWTSAGHTWTQQELNNRNQGGFSPALHPAVDPTAHHDAEHEDDQEGSPGDDIKVLCKPVHQFRLADLWMRPSDLPDLSVELYKDTVDWTITSTWNSSHSKTRPKFSFTMYLATDTPPFFAQALFHCLDWGLLKKSTWALDVIRVPDVESAYYHYSHETPNRSVCKIRRRQSCARAVLDRVAGSVLPEELVQYIESMIVPPAHPNYSFLPGRPFPGMFLYLDSSAQLTGPSIIYTRVKSKDVALTGREIDGILRPQRIDESEDELLISKLQHWRLVADELHTIWSMCSRRSELSTFPKLTLSLHFPDVCNYDLRFRPTLQNMPNPKIVVTNCSLEPVTVFPSFTPDFWLAALVIDDLTEGVRMPDSESRSFNAPSPRWHSWSEDDLTQPDPFALRTLYPGIEATFSMNHEVLTQIWWPARYRAGHFKNEHHYRVRVRDGLRIPRWTFGAVGALKGPYNLPPLPVHVENEARFIFKVGNVQSWKE